MTSPEAKAVLDKIVGQVFGYQNPFTLEQFIQKFAFDVRLPAEVHDSTTGELTWASSTNPTKFMTLTNTREHLKDTEFMLPKRPLNNIQDILAAWNETNYTATERYTESINVHESDCIYSCENVFRSQDCSQSKNVLFTDSGHHSENIAAVQRSKNITNSIRVDDSQNTDSSFSVSWSNKVTKSFFINDCFDVMECMFCSHIAGKRFCVANIQLEEAEYRKLEKEVKRWILTG